MHARAEHIACRKRHIATPEWRVATPARVVAINTDLRGTAAVVAHIDQAIRRGVATGLEQQTGASASGESIDLDAGPLVAAKGLLPVDRCICAAHQLVSGDGWPAARPVRSQGWASAVEVIQWPTRNRAGCRRLGSGGGVDRGAVGCRCLRWGLNRGRGRRRGGSGDNAAKIATIEIIHDDCIVAGG